MQPARQAFTRESADARRGDLIDATAACLAEVGMTGTSVRAICARAGVSPGLLRHYFAGIDDLVAATYEATSDRMDAIFAEAVAGAGTDPHAQLLAYLTASFRPPVTDPELLGAWTAFWALARSNARMANIHADSYAGYRARLGELLTACGAADAERLAIMLTAMVDGLWLELSLDAESFGAEAAVAMVERAVAALV
ncbi:TetR family transcriptional regulator [Sphingopyxis bauzanensis]|uniref:TetR family transcriptional regulator n=1 Tax=Sphingopyxis bauzanensis TaxID=651663 RepID=A0A246K1G1_9SPHN|nr:TetR family transcriptional regulator C-terminal domain-containing protein [Sphingopyxis bauzanensis]MDP3783696.1 TetR family transcriptional regulator C-terminal domain-containing protein [Sphingopyxis sp.]OWQ99355.1 TetR family transcriptional regulator [Sphingopyxis bauzanensis]GGJ55616.1 TetR family transcriptional regulator [Sphingopyxis bauzanensis]